MSSRLQALPQKLVDGCFPALLAIEKQHGPVKTVALIKSIRPDEHGQSLGEIEGATVPIVLLQVTSGAWYACRVLHPAILIAAFFAGWKTLLLLVITGAADLLFLASRKR
ncbi:MAG TPA: hypothetical protein VGS41_07920 [Chthonomonadales bacterium]|nr:hypothetical protein [Chthonomonadales bacterium]